jgi:hypothetical protein
VGPAMSTNDRVQKMVSVLQDLSQGRLWMVKMGKEEGGDHGRHHYYSIPVSNFHSSLDNKSKELPKRTANIINHQHQQHSSGIYSDNPLERAKNEHYDVGKYSSEYINTVHDDLDMRTMMGKYICYKLITIMIDFVPNIDFIPNIVDTDIENEIDDQELIFKMKLTDDPDGENLIFSCCYESNLPIVKEALSDDHSEIHGEMSSETLSEMSVGTTSSGVFGGLYNDKITKHSSYCISYCISRCEKYLILVVKEPNETLRTSDTDIKDSTYNYYMYYYTIQKLYDDTKKYGIRTHHHQPERRVDIGKYNLTWDEIKQMYWINDYIIFVNTTSGITILHTNDSKFFRHYPIPELIITDVYYGESNEKSRLVLCTRGLEPILWDCPITLMDFINIGKQQIFSSSIVAPGLPNPICISLVNKSCKMLPKMMIDNHEGNSILGYIPSCLLWINSTQLVQIVVASHEDDQLSFIFHNLFQLQEALSCDCDIETPLTVHWCKRLIGAYTSIHRYIIDENMKFYVHHTPVSIFTSFVEILIESLEHILIDKLLLCIASYLT